MTRELYLKKADAMEAAGQMVRLWGGWIADTTVDDRTEFNYEDVHMRNKCWSGELNAVHVFGCRNGICGTFAWWEE